jgi:eukaryotic-like serine/threonine-protein kinase
VYCPTCSGSVRAMPATEQRVSLPPRYRVVRHIASGGMASVWAAEDELLGRLVAVKLLSHAYDADERARKRFLREARAAARLGDCRHVVTVYDIGEHDDRAYMVMEYFAGGTVAQRLRKGRRLPRPLALRWLRETAIALDCAHEHDVVHRDVKPANLLLDEHGRLAVGDFGIATVASEASVTQTGTVLGTAAYISPEQARGAPATAASDRYALAVVAFELLTGARPFPVDHPAAQARAHVQARVPDATEVAPDLPAGVDAVLRDGLAKDPDARPATGEELVDRLEDALGDEATAVAPPPTATTRRFEVPPATERRAAGPPTTAPRAPLAAAAPAVRRVPSDGRRPAGAAVTGPRRPTTPPPWPPVATHGRRRWPAVAALAALLLVAGSVAAIALTGGGGGSSAGGSASATTTTTTTSARAKSTGTTSSRSHTTSTHARRASTATSATASTPSKRSTSSTSSAASGDPRQLNDRGFALIQEGNNAAAVPLLQGSVQGFRKQGRTGELNYAFALYNLATALRATGHPGDAIPLLEERLRISSYKRDVVQRELALARQQAGQPAVPGASTPGEAPKAGKGNRAAGGGKAKGKGHGHGGEGDGGDGGDGGDD